MNFLQLISWTNLPFHYLRPRTLNAQEVKTKQDPRIETPGWLCISFNVYEKCIRTLKLAEIQGNTRAQLHTVLRVLTVTLCRCRRPFGPFTSNAKGVGLFMMRSGYAKTLRFNQCMYFLGTHTLGTKRARTPEYVILRTHTRSRLVYTLSQSFNLPYRAREKRRMHITCLPVFKGAHRGIHISIPVSPG